MAGKEGNHSGTLLYVLRRDLRISDNPILNQLVVQKPEKSFQHLLPVYVFAANQLEVSGFLQDPESKSPYPEARSRVGNFWRCGPHRARFLGESVLELKENFESVGSGLCLRVGLIGEVVKELITKLTDSKSKISAVWMVGEEGVEEAEEEKDVKKICEEAGVQYKLWADEKFFVDDRDLPFKNIEAFPDIFTDYRKKVEPLRERPRPVLPTPDKGSLPSYPQNVPAQDGPFAIPTTPDGLQDSLLAPLKAKDLVENPPIHPDGTESAHPFTGGENQAHLRLVHLLNSGAATNYHSTRNGVLGLDYSTKLSAYLSLGSITARQIHASLVTLEDGTDSSLRSVTSFGKGQNDGTKAIRFELLWRDYMRLCTRKYGAKLFRLSGFKNLAEAETKWVRPSSPGEGTTSDELTEKITRVLNGTTGMGFIDASMRELFLTGYTSNRTRQNIASFMAKHLKIDWRIGAEWFESMLVDYDLSSNWGNWQYLAGVGNDPRGDARIFNPVKQAYDYDSEGKFVRAWCPEFRSPDLTLGEVFQGWTIAEAKRETVGVKGLIAVEKPLLRIEFTVGKRGNNNRFRGSGRGEYNGRGNRDDRGGRGGGPGRWGNGRGGNVYNGDRGGGGAYSGGGGYGGAGNAGGGYGGNGYNGGGYASRGYGSTRGTGYRGGSTSGYIPRYRGDFRGAEGHRDYHLANMGGNSAASGVGQTHVAQVEPHFGGAQGGPSQQV